MSQHNLPQLFADQLITALEGGSNYWVGCVSPLYESVASYADPSNYHPRMTPRTFVDEDGSNVLDWEALNRGYLIMRDKYPHHWADMVEETGDAITADVFLQCCLFGEIVYG